MSDDNLLNINIYNHNSNIVAIIIAFHGIGGHGGYYQYIAEKVAPYSFMVVAPDCRGHGLSEGKRGDLKIIKVLDDIKQIIDHFKSIYPNVPIFILGESMGGCLVISFINKYDIRDMNLKGILLFSPAVGMSLRSTIHIPITLRILGTIIYFIAPGLPIIKGYDGDDDLQLRKYSVRYIYNLFKYMKKAMTSCFEWVNIPIIIFQGSDDDLIDPEAVKCFYDNIPQEDKEFVFIPGGSHCLFNDDLFAGYFRRLTEFILSNCTSKIDI